MKIFGDKQYLYQWDVNQKVISDRLKLGDEIHFVVPDSEEVLICPVYEQDEFIMADIPNILLQTAGLIKAYEVAYDENGDNLKTYRSAVRVVKRPKPSDYAYTETEVKNYHTLERRIDDLEEFTEMVPDWVNKSVASSYILNQLGAQPADCIIHAQYGMTSFDKSYEEILKSLNDGATLVLYHNGLVYDFVGFDDGFIFERMHISHGYDYDTLNISRCIIYGTNEGFYIDSYSQTLIPKQTELWKFTLSDGTVIEKEVYIK